MKRHPWRQSDMSADLCLLTVIPEISHALSFTHKKTHWLTYMDTYSLSVSLFLCECARWCMPHFPECLESLRQHNGVGTSGFQGRGRGCRDEAWIEREECEREETTWDKMDNMRRKKTTWDEEEMRGNNRRFEMRWDNKRQQQTIRDETEMRGLENRPNERRTEDQRWDQRRFKSRRYN